ncbi:MAG: mechanosensitive ion channel family protein [Nitrospinota bacterium]
MGHTFEYIRNLNLKDLLPLIRVAVLLFVGITIVAWMVRKTRIYITKKFSAQQGLIVSKIILYTGLSLIFISILRELGFQLSTLVGAAGIVGIAVGFASQTSVSNIISGLFLIAERPFEVNDIITVGNITGAVLSIDILSIKLRTFDNKFVRIPNETIIKSDVTNVTRFPIRRIDIPVGVAYKEDIAKVRALLLDIARNEKVCLNEPEPIVILSGFGNSSVDMLLLVWAEKADWLQAKNSITESIKMRFDEEGIEIPFPHVSIYAGSETPPFPVKIISDNQ